MARMWLFKPIASPPERDALDGQQLPPHLDRRIRVRHAIHSHPNEHMGRSAAARELLWCTACMTAHYLVHRIDHGDCGDTPELPTECAVGSHRGIGA